MLTVTLDSGIIKTVYTNHCTGLPGASCRHNWGLGGVTHCLESEECLEIPVLLLSSIIQTDTTSPAPSKQINYLCLHPTATGSEARGGGAGRDS